MNELMELGRLHSLQRLIDTARGKTAEHYEFWVEHNSRDIFAARIVGGRVYLHGRLSYDDIEETDHLSEFEYESVPLSDEDRRRFSCAESLMQSRATMVGKFKKRKQAKR